MSNERASIEQVKNFLDVLNDIGISVRRFCEIAAGEEYNLTDDEIVSLVETYRKRFSRKSMLQFDLNIMTDILEQQPEYKSSKKIRLSRKENTFENTNFESLLMSSFKALK